MRRIGFLLAFIALAAAPTSSAAQRVSSGWIGISFNVVTTGTPSGAMRRFVMITDVSRGSPARAAGVRRGDVVLRINHVAGTDSLNDLRNHLHLTPGDSVHLVITRDGREYTRRMAAAARPDAVEVNADVSFRFVPDSSMVQSFARAMDSMRLRLVEAQTAGVTVLSQDGTGNVALVRPDTLTTIITGSGGAWSVEASNNWSRDDWSILELREPFEARLFGGERFDSLEREMQALNIQIREVDEERADRIRELNRRNRSVRSDAQLRRLEEALERSRADAIRLRKAMQDDAWERSGGVYTVVGVPQVGRTSRADEAPVEVFRPLAPYFLGQNRAIGAEIIDLGPGLAEYLDVDYGVFVTDVPAGTPAAIAGIQAGDVITKIDQVTVRSVEDLRLALSRAGSEIPLTLMRHGSSRQVLLRR